MEFKNRPDHFNFYIGDVDDKLYATLKKEVDGKIDELRNIDRENAAYARGHGLEMVTPQNVKFIFHVATYGGFVYDGLGICDMLHNLDVEDNGIDVVVRCEGMVMSMGIPIICSVRNRIGTAHTSYMIHQVSAGHYGKIETLKEDLNEVNRLWDECKKIIVDNTKITMQEIEEWDRCRRDVYFGAEEALRRGLINKIV